MKATCKSPTLSLVIPAYNEAEYLAACLDSVAAQSVMPDEVIVVDNNSTDTTAKIAKRYPFVTLLHETRQGLRFSRNTGMDRCRSDLIGRIDAESRLDADWVKKAKDTFAKNGPIHALTGPCYYHDMPYKNIGLQGDVFCRSAVFTFSRPMVYGSNMVIRRTAWNTIRHTICMEGEFFEDCDLSIHMYEQSLRIVYEKGLVVGVSARRLDDSPLAFYRNMAMYDKTYAMHNTWSGSAQAAKLIYLSLYPGLKTLRLAYDVKNDKVSPMHLFRTTRRQVARPTSNT